MSKPLPLTLILAATPSLGIGRAGGLPWPSLRTEMGYFARVTKRVPVSTGSEGSGTANGKRLINAVVMGRKTWDSIPEKFRPLKGRLNVVITRDVKGFLSREGKREVTRDEGPIVAGSLEDALEILRGINNPSPASATSSTQKADDGRDSIPSDVRINHTFITGGSTLYTSALSLPQTVRILLTEIKTEYECDTFFGLDLGSEEAKRCGWRKRDVGAVREWTGEEKEGNVVVEGGVEEKGVRFEFGMWEREVEGV
ncbi:dihydrofolate reductase-like domain-containing protein [Dendryphion nanum]|uniref:Dihydrofolate reductase n=1 Tax=Dendryphion nanum TaxID=256645 RepID=A0A9P9I8M0_9PLEO|nr:dihydrofolate reductase-like domain-containing protein [Dendryphion nanum]